MATRPYGVTLDYGQAPNLVPDWGDETDDIFDVFFSRSNYVHLIRELSRRNYGTPHWTSLTPTMKHVYGANRWHVCRSGCMTRDVVARHVSVLNRRVLEIVVPRIQVEINAWNGYLRDRAGLTLIDQPVSDSCRVRWEPIDTGRLLD